MKRILLFSLTFLTLFADVKPSIRNTETINDDTTPSLVSEKRPAQQEDMMEEVGDDYSDAPKNYNLNMVQESFFYARDTPTSNTQNVDYRAGEKVKVRLRSSMTTNIVFENEIITDFVLGNGGAFQGRIFKNSPNAESNVLILNPVDDFIGMDSNLTVFTKSGKIFLFYIFSVDFTSPKDPAFLVAVKSDKYDIPREKPKSKWKKTAPAKVITPAQKNTATPAQSKTTPKATPKTTPKEQTAQPVEKITIRKIENIKQQPQAPLLEAKDKAENNGEVDKKDYREISYKAVTKIDGNFIRIGDEVNYMWIDKRKIKGGYIQKPKKSNLKPTRGALEIVAQEIFDDGKFTYFKYDRENTGNNFPALYEVVDDYDGTYDYPVNFRVVGDYIIAENISNRWTLRLGDDWVCVRKEAKKK